jgi:hypothetical protein
MSFFDHDEFDAHIENCDADELPLYQVENLLRSAMHEIDNSEEESIADQIERLDSLVSNFDGEDEDRESILEITDDVDMAVSQAIMYLEHIQKMVEKVRQHHEKNEDL